VTSCKKHFSPLIGDIGKHEQYHIQFFLPVNPVHIFKHAVPDLQKLTAVHRINLSYSQLQFTNFELLEILIKKLFGTLACQIGTRPEHGKGKFLHIQSGNSRQAFSRFPVHIGTGRRLESQGIRQNGRTQNSCNLTVYFNTVLQIQIPNYCRSTAYRLVSEIHRPYGFNIPYPVMVDYFQYISFLKAFYCLRPLIVIDKHHLFPLQINKGSP